jgi:nucleoid-associated protein YgaU
MANKCSKAVLIMLFIKQRRINPIKLFKMIIVTSLLVITILSLIKSSAVGLTKDYYKEYTVCPGDTLWMISKECRPNENIEKVIYEIMISNNMNKSDLYPGQKLKIPSKY